MLWCLGPSVGYRVVRLGFTMDPHGVASGLVMDLIRACKWTYNGPTRWTYNGLFVGRKVDSRPHLGCPCAKWACYGHTRTQVWYWALCWDMGHIMDRPGPRIGHAAASLWVLPCTVAEACRCLFSFQN